MNTNGKRRRVVITGLGVVTSLSCQVDDLWKRILAGESGVHELKLFDTHDFKIRFGGDIYDWDPSQFISDRDLKRLDRFSQFAMVAAAEAVQTAGIDFAAEDPFRCGVVIGSGIGGLGEIEVQMVRLMTKGPDRVSPMTIPKLMLNAAGANLSIKYNIRGANYSVATACASANNAIGDAFRLIQHGETDVVMTGGTEAAMTRMGLSGFQNMKALSSRNEAPARASRPFDRDRDGFVLSEGAGIIILEEYEHARKRGAVILAEMLGVGASGDAGHITHPDDQGAGAARAMANALEDAGLNPADVDYINAHGTSTPLGDKAETHAVKTVFGESAKTVSLSSTKSHLGHSLGASGGIELVLTVKALLHQVAPPTINLENPDPECDLDYTPITPKERPIKIAMSNSFGFGGHNACVVIGKPRDAK